MASWQELHDFWFGNALNDPSALKERMHLWFLRDESMDRAARERFAPWLENSERFLQDWRAEPVSALTLILLWDQIPRNAFRGTPRAFAWDASALALAEELRPRAQLLKPLERFFLWLPFEHAENMAAQEIARTEMRRLAAEAPAAAKEFFAIAVDMADRHAEAIRRFGRFPHRNEVLGRESSPEEREFLTDARNRF